MNFNHDTGTIDTMLIVDTTVTPPLGGQTNSLTILGTGSLFLPFGTTAQRPVNSTGQIRYNTDTGTIEFNNGSAWITSGGSVTSVAVSGSTGLTVGGSPITTSGTVTLTLDAGLQSLASLATTGVIVQTAADTFTSRTITGTAGNIVVADGSGVTGNPTINLATAGTPVTAALVKITTDTFGRITATTPVVTGDVTALVDATYVNVAGDSMTAGANLTFSGGGTVTGLPTTPTNATDAASKAYVDSIAQGMDPKGSVRAATTVTGTLATSFEDGDIIDNVTLATDDLILIKNQAAPAENGIYKVNATGAPTRAVNMDTWLEVPGAFTWVEQGTTNANTGWVCTSNQGGTLNTTPITFVPFGGIGSFTAGTGLTLTGNQFSLTVPVAVANGGTGVSTTPTDGQLLIGNGTGYTVAALTQGAGITIANGAGSITITNAGVTSIAGTANQITASAATGAVILSTPSTFTAPGSITSTTTITAGSNFIASTATSSYTSTAGTTIQVIPGIAATATSAGNTLTLQGGPGGGTSGAGGTVTVLAGTPTSGAGGAVNITASNGVGTNQNGGNVTITAGNATGTGTNGVINLVIPTPGALQINGAAGTAGQVIMSNGATATPTWQSVQSGLSLYRENPSTPTTPIATGTNAVAFGTNSNATAVDSFAVGNGSTASLYGAKAYANGSFTAAGDAQKMQLVLRGITTNATITEIFLDGATATQRMVLTNNSLWTFSIYVAGRRTDATGGGAGYRVDGVIRRDTTAGSTTLIGAVTKSVLGETNAAWDVTVDADTTNGSLRVRVTGEAAKTIRWVASAEVVQVVN
jgi:hypothetical protein